MKTKHVTEVIKEGWKVDKLKLEIKYRKIEEIQALVWAISNDNYVVESYESKILSKCAKNYKVELPGGMVYIGVGKNSHQGNWKENQKSIILEFNPSKVNPFKEIEYLEHITMMDKNRIDIMSLDMAYDIYTHISSLEMDKRHGNEKYGVWGSNDVETLYRGDMGNNHIKLYNKAKELNKTVRNEDTDQETGEVTENKVKIIGDCTRFEITMAIPPKERFLVMCATEEWHLEQLIQLPQLRFKKSEDDIKDEILKLEGKDCINVMAIHMGLEKKFKEQRTRKKYKEMYQDIKNKSLGCEANDSSSMLNKFCFHELYITLYNYLRSTFKGKMGIIPTHLLNVQ